MAAVTALTMNGSHELEGCTCRTPERFLESLVKTRNQSNVAVFTGCFNDASRKIGERRIGYVEQARVPAYQQAS